MPRRTSSHSPLRSRTGMPEPMSSREKPPIAARPRRAPELTQRHVPQSRDSGDQVWQRQAGTCGEDPGTASFVTSCEGLRRSPTAPAETDVALPIIRSCVDVPPG